MAKYSTTFSMEELKRNPENLMEVAEYATCSNHHGEDIKYYCKDHQIPCCSTCIKTCKVTDIEKELPVLQCNRKPDEMITDMKKIEIHLMTFMEMNESCVDYPGVQTNMKNQIIERYEKFETAIVSVEFSTIIDSILSLSVSELVKVEPLSRSIILPLTGSRSRARNCKVDVVDIIDLKAPTVDVPCYIGVTFLPGDERMLVDHDNKHCILLSSSYQFITSHKLIGDHFNVCVLDDQEVAVSLIHQNIIQILSVVDDVIRPVRMMPTKYSCNGIATAGKGEVVENWYCGNTKSEWNLNNRRGKVKYSHHYDCLFSTYNTYNCVALNNRKQECVYVSADLMDLLLCFDMDGKSLFTYKAVNLTCPRGVDVDKYDIIYVIGQSSNNIHQLSPNGSVLQVITSAVPTCPYAICIHKSKDMFVVTNFEDKTNLYLSTGINYNR
ncbi:hypothetical protein CHS0354_026574 [Potamilus streckersoni]|uniref:B box-type domain-containing protein n=1 Tax=Potamilus streckersoni TaxID=2493646 RepID=A0AAE0TIS6_9BIVA|nr:hypothetical protein CHS0354_026574 [Potamilus streckersoni]